MNEMQVFQNSEFGELGVLEVNGKPYFSATACAKMLGYANPRDAIGRHCNADGVVKHDVIDSMGRTQRAKFITEGNLYRLITHSKLPKAEQFEKWVFDEVLPTIRQTGGYGSQTAGLTKLAEQMAQATIAMVQVASAMTTVVDKLTGLVDKMSSHPITLEGELDSTPRLFRSSTANCLKLETFPDEIVDEVDRMLALMREQQALNFSQIARFCTMNGYTISSPSVKRYFDRHFQEVSDGQR